MRVKNGDVIKVNRGFYNHYGVYVEASNTVIHYTGENGPSDFHGIVRETSLKEFLNGSENFSVCEFPKDLQEFAASMKNNRHSKFLFLVQLLRLIRLRDYHLYSGNETVERAKSKLGQSEYDLVFNNCEHFAVWCKTGVKNSSQVNRILDIAASFLG